MTSLCFLHPLRPPGGATLARLSCPELGACSSPCSLAARRASSHAAAPSPVCELRAAGARSRARRASTGGAVCSSKSAPRPQTVPKAGASTASSSVADQRPFAPVPYLDLHNRAFASELSGRSPLAVPLYVMLPLDTVNVLGVLSNPKALSAGLRALRSIGVDGVSVDVWWGVVESKAPEVYDWSAYEQLFSLVQQCGLKLQVVLSFHSCGCNVGDSCTVSLPPWVLAVAETDPDVFFTDAQGLTSDEYLSFATDDLPLLRGRSPVECYSDFCHAFRRQFSSLLGPDSLIPVVAVSLGPAGELRYPSYPEGRWRFPGIGAFQCYDKYSLASLKAAALKAGSPEWGTSGPHDAGSYYSAPGDTGFFHDTQGSWASPYGQFFLSWYAGQLTAHGDRVLGAAAAAFAGSGASVAGKLPGVHWHFKTRAHAAEATAGVHCAGGRDGYAPLVAVFARHGALLDFTCAEMSDHETPPLAACGPEALLSQLRHTAARFGVPLAAENALPRFDAHAHEQIVRNAYEPGGPELPPLASFTYLRMSERLFQPSNWTSFVAFVRRMAFSGDARQEEEREPSGHMLARATSQAQ